MKSFRSEIENPIVEKDIVELEKKIFQFKNQQIDEEKFRSLRLARGVYGQRQSGVQMIRIKLPMGQFTAQQLRRMAAVSDQYASGNLHITTRQDIQLHYVLLDHTPALWSELEKEAITLREACGNTVRNVTTSIKAGIDPNEAFDPTPYAEAFFQYFLRNPICQDMGRKFKVAFSCAVQDEALTFIHDLGFIPKIKNGEKGFRVMLGGGIGSQPVAAHVVYDFLPSDQLIPFSEATLRVFDREGERNRRNKARLKFLIKEVGIQTFLKWVEDERKVLFHKEYPIKATPRQIKAPTYKGTPPTHLPPAFAAWKAANTFKQKQTGYHAVGIPIPLGDINTKTAYKIAVLLEKFTGDDNRFTPGQSLLLRDVPTPLLPALYIELEALDLVRIGFHRINDIVACPGTDTCNLGIASSMGLAKVLQELLENEFAAFIARKDLQIKISGCMNACGQHSIAPIGFQGMTLKQGDKIAPATQVLLGGATLHNGQGRFADKVLKVPARKTPEVLRWILTDFNQNGFLEESFVDYYDRKTKAYFYQNLKHFAQTETLTPLDFIDFGNDKEYEKAIGIGECAGVTIDLVATLLFDAQETYQRALEALDEKHPKDALSHAYNTRIRAAKAALTSVEAKTNSHASILSGFDLHFPQYKQHFGLSFQEETQRYQTQVPTYNFIQTYVAHTANVIEWIQLNLPVTHVE